MIKSKATQKPPSHTCPKDSLADGCENTEENSDEEFTLQKLRASLSCHGVADFHLAKTTGEKAVWSIILGSFIIFLGYGLFETVKEFYDNPIVSSISFQSSSWVDFPQVYICPGSKINYSAVDPYTLQKLNNLTDKGGQQAKSSKASFNSGTASRIRIDIFAVLQGTRDDKTKSTSEPTLLGIKKTVWSTAAGSIYEGAGTAGDLPPGGGGGGVLPIPCWFLNNGNRSCEKLATTTVPPSPEIDYEALYGNESMQEMYMRIGLKLRLFLLECAFQSRTFSCENRTTEILDTSVGKCFLMDVKEKASKQGLGLDVVMSIPTDSQQKDFNDPGVTLSLDPWIRIGHRFDPFSQDQILLSRLQQTRISLRPTKVWLLNRPSGATPQKCFTSSRTNPLKVFNTSYTVDSCQADCIQVQVLSRCNCLLPVDKRYVKRNFTDISICLGVNMTECVGPFVNELSEAASKLRQHAYGDASTLNDDPARLNYISNVHEDFHKCVVGCDRPCEYTRYSMTVSQRGIDAYSMKPNILMLEVVFDSLDVTHIVQRPSVTLAEFVSDLGGQLGIWFGASLLTVCQLLTFSIIYFNSSNRRPKSKESTRIESVKVTHSSDPKSVADRRAFY